MILLETFDLRTAVISVASYLLLRSSPRPLCLTRSTLAIPSKKKRGKDVQRRLAFWSRLLFSSQLHSLVGRAPPRAAAGCPHRTWGRRSPVRGNDSATSGKIEAIEAHTVVGVFAYQSTRPPKPKPKPRGRSSAFVEFCRPPPPFESLSSLRFGLIVRKRHGEGDIARIKSARKNWGRRS